jgi:hypothetical protein
MASGTVILQSNNQSDIFHVAQIIEDGIEPSDESSLKIEDGEFESDKAWITGRVPKMRSVNVEGDTTIINAWFKAESFDKAFTITVYVECELAEELEEVVPIKPKEILGENRKKKIDPLEPMEIHL